MGQVEPSQTADVPSRPASRNKERELKFTIVVCSKKSVTAAARITPHDSLESWSPSSKTPQLASKRWSLV